MVMVNLFQVHMLNEVGLAKASGLANAFDQLWQYIEDNVPEGRERSLVATKLQEASFFAKRGIAMLKENQKE